MLFETHIEKIIASCGTDVESFFAALKTLQEKDSDN